MNPRALGLLLLSSVLAACHHDSPPAAQVINLAPLAGAGVLRASTAHEDFTLGGAATDPEGDLLTYLWELLTSPAGANVTILLPASATTDVTGTLPAGDYTFRLTVSDATHDVVVNVSVTLADPPVPDPVPTATAFVFDRQSVPLAGAIQTTAPFAGGAPYPAPVLATAYEGGYSGLSRALDAVGAPVPNEFWIVNDRGPNYGISARVPPAPPGSPAFGAGAKLFPLPAYAQKILRVRLNAATGALEHLSSTPVRTIAGLASTGLPSSVVGLTTAESAHSDLQDRNSLVAPSPAGHDFEGIFEDRILLGGTDRRVFWTCDEYGPAVQMIEADSASPDFGRILREFIPGAALDVANGIYPLPAVLRNRRDNRGFEGIAVTRDHVWAMVQSNLQPAFTGNGNARLHRLVRIRKSDQSVRMYGYDHIANPAAFGSSHGGVKIGDMVAIGECEFLVLEHDGARYAHVYRIRFDDRVTEPLEAQQGGYEAGTTPYTPVEKVLVADLTSLLNGLGVPTKPEGLTLVDPWTLALAFDNDYGFESNETDVYQLPADASRNMMLLVRLPAPVIPSLHFVSEINSGLGAGNGEIVDLETSSGLGFFTAAADESVQVFDLTTPARPYFVRRDGLGVGSATSVTVHQAFGYYLVAIQGGAGGGDDAVQVRATATGALLRTINIGTAKGPDAIKISPNGRFAVLCNEAEAPWRPGSVMVFDLGAGPFATPQLAANSIAAPTEIPLDGLLPAAGAFSTRWVDRLFNAPLEAGLTAATANGPVVFVNGEARVTDPNGALVDDTLVTFTFAGQDYPSRYKFDGALSAGNDGNVFLFQLDGDARRIEPELAAFDAGSTLAIVTLQENNAVAIVDLTLSPPALRAGGVFGLGKVDYPDADTVRRSPTPTSPARFVNPLNTEREPDGVGHFAVRGVEYFVTADEGDTWGSDYTQSSNARQRGGRTLSVFRLADGALMGDTGNRLDVWVNAAGRWGAFIEDSRARRGASEPENLDVVTWGDRVLCVVGLERANALALVDLTNPACPGVIGGAGIGGLSTATARAAPEGIRIVEYAGRTLVLVAFEASGTVGIFEIR